jgi:hypothetical protein
MTLAERLEYDKGRAGRQRRVDAAERAKAAPAKPAQPRQETAAERTQREARSAALKECAAIILLCQEYGQPDPLGAEMFRAGKTLEQARVELQKLKAAQVWDDALAAAQALH